jgi:maltooligosyltrehalose trehalohydrolase
MYLTAPFVPMLFMGEEWGASTPFQYFTSHSDPDLARSVTAGRRREFDEPDIPDPQDPATFERSKLHPEAGDDELRAFYGELIALRRSLPRKVDTDADEARRILRVKRGDHELVADFANMTAVIR